MWHFDKIPDDQKAEALSCWEKGNFRELIAIYNKYKVAPQKLSSCCDSEAVAIWTKYAIRNELLKK